MGILQHMYFVQLALKKTLVALVKPTHPMEIIKTICASKQVEMERGR